ncbi:MAG: toxin, partial [Collimonas sp.]
NLAGFQADLTTAEIERFFAAPKSPFAAEILAQASTRIVYDTDRFHRSGQPAFAATLSRETHSSELVAGQHSKMQIGFSYSDGFGREIQKKIQAEPGLLAEDDKRTIWAESRWIGSGWTIYNNKGKPVRQYEPFFDDTHGFKFGRQVGVSPVLLYDPAGRVAATLHPDHSFQKTVFDPWRQASWDVNDTVLIGDPADDQDVGAFFRRLPENDYLPSWHDYRITGAHGYEEQNAARKTVLHAATPGIVHADTLGRAMLGIAHNRYSSSPHLSLEGDSVREEFYANRTRFDIQGNQREVIDAKARIVMRYDYDLRGGRIHQASMEAGERWLLNDAMGKPIRVWDSRGRQYRSAYDALRRPLDAFMQEQSTPELLVGRTMYGETQATPEARNLRNKVVRIMDQAGVVSSDDYDFKGNLLRGRRQLSLEYKNTLDWAVVVALDATIYTSHTRYDAINRPIELTSPDQSVIRPIYNEANLLERVEAQLGGSATVSTFVSNIGYDAKGQRTLIEYGNGMRTTYRYDALTFRLVHLSTARNPQAAAAIPERGHLQNLYYSYDPSGNITHIRDDAQQENYFRNRRVEPSNDYTYDATYRLIAATGREHLGQGNSPAPYSSDDATRIGLPQPGDGDAMARYAEHYLYDAVGNLLAMQHRGSDPAQAGWKRSYRYDEASQLEAGQLSNRLSSTRLGAAVEAYRYDGSAGLHGDITAMPHLHLMQWDYRDQLQATAR